ncbi:hypothetical protein NECAME_08539, partial [Necator americanus]
LASPGPCYVHIYTADEGKIYTRFAAADSSSGSHQDEEISSPSAGGANIAMFHLHESQNFKGSLHYVEVLNAETSEVNFSISRYLTNETCYFYY